MQHSRKRQQRKRVFILKRGQSGVQVAAAVGVVRVLVMLKVSPRVMQLIKGTRGHWSVNVDLGRTESSLKEAAKTVLKEAGRTGKRPKKKTGRDTNAVTYM